MGGDPTRLMRLSDAGASFLQRWSAAPDRTLEVTDTSSAGVTALVDRLVTGAMAHPVIDARERGAQQLTVIVPVFERTGPLDRCLAALGRSGVGRVVVCDDASTNGDEIRAVAERHGASVVRREVNGGPSAARMAGWEAVRADLAADPSSLVAFVDSDIDVTAEWADRVVGHFEDESVGLVAPRVVHRAGQNATLVDRYEVANSPLDLGERPAPIVAGTRVSYVPAAALVIRATTFGEVGGFDPSLTVGEDVDLLWRLAEAGWRCRYEPDAVVEHRGRSTVRTMLRRRVDYGRSAAPLDRKHPGTLPPVRVNRWSLGVVAALAAGHPIVSACLWAWTVRSMGKRFDALDGFTDSRRLAIDLTTRGHLAAGRQLGRAAIRPWFPLVILLTGRSKRFRRAAVMGVLVEPVLSWRRTRPAVDPLTFAALVLADDLAYSIGVWAGCVDERSARVLLPEITGED